MKRCFELQLKTARSGKTFIRKAAVNLLQRPVPHSGRKNSRSKWTILRVWFRKTFERRMTGDEVRFENWAKYSKRKKGYGPSA